VEEDDMKTIKRELINETITGLLLAATVGAIMPTDAFAQLSTATQNADTTIVQPALHVVSLISYALGTVMVVAGIANAKKHADQPASNPLGPAIGKLGAGAAFLAAPTVVGMLETTGNATAAGTAAFQSIAF
jgi:hypothetical protein